MGSALTYAFPLDFLVAELGFCLSASRCCCRGVGYAAAAAACGGFGAVFSRRTLVVVFWCWGWRIVGFAWIWCCACFFLFLFVGLGLLALATATLLLFLDPAVFGAAFQF